MGKLTTTTTITCSVPNPSCDHDILAVMCQLTDAPAVSFENKADALNLQIKSTNAFTKRTTESTAVSLVGCVRYLATSANNNGGGAAAAAAGSLMGDSDAAVAEVESWIASVEQTLMPITRGGAGELLVETVQDFINKVGTHLGGSSYLVGDSATAADVCVAMALVAIGTKYFSGKLTWPSKTLAWMETIFGQLDAVVDSVGRMAWAGFKDLNASSNGATAPPAATAAPAPTAPAATAATGGDNEIINLLQSQGVEYSLYDHPLSETAEDLVVNAPLPDGETHTKNLFMKDKKNGMVCVTVATNAKTTTPVNTKNLGKLMGLTGKVNFRMADEALLLEHLKCKKGCLGPLCMAIATSSSGDDKITFVMDKSLLTYQKIHSHPLRNDQSVSMTPDALLGVLMNAGVEPMLVEFEPEASTPADGGGGGSGGGGDASAAKPKEEAQKKGEKKGPAGGGNKKTVKK